MLVCMGDGRIYPGGAVVDFSESFCRGAKVVRFVFSPLKTKKTAFLAKVFKFLSPLPTPMLVCRRKFVPRH